MSLQERGETKEFDISLMFETLKCEANFTEIKSGPRSMYGFGHKNIALKIRILSRLGC